MVCLSVSKCCNKFLKATYVYIYFIVLITNRTDTHKYIAMFLNVNISKFNFRTPYSDFIYIFLVLL